MASRLEAIATRLEAITSRLEDIARGLEAIPSLVGWATATRLEMVGGHCS